MELTPPVQRQHRKVVRNNKSTKNKYGNSEKEINYIKNRSAELYHPPTDVMRERMISELTNNLKTGDNGSRKDAITSSSLEIPHPPIDRCSESPKIDAKKFSYTSLSSLRRRKTITPEEYLDAKAVKAGFRNQYERVLTRYSEVLKALKLNVFRNPKEKRKILMKKQGMEKYLKEVDKLRNKTNKCSI